MATMVAADEAAPILTLYNRQLFTLTPCALEITLSSISDRV